MPGYVATYCLKKKVSANGCPSPSADRPVGISEQHRAALCCLIGHDFDDKRSQSLAQEINLSQRGSLGTHLVEIQNALEPLENQLNGTITNDKFCMSRTGRLTLTWWRRPLRSRSAKADEGVYPSGEIACRGGIHETPMEGPPSVD